MTIKPTWASLIVLLTPLLISGNASAEIYKWTDKNGKVHFSSTPPKNTATKAKNIEDDIKFKIGKVQPASAPKPVAIPATVGQENAKSKGKKNKTKVAAKDPYKGDKTPSRLAYCNKLRSNIHMLESSKNKKLVRKGETRPLSEDERASRLKADQATMNKNCKGL